MRIRLQKRYPRLTFNFIWFRVIRLLTLLTLQEVQGCNEGHKIVGYSSPNNILNFRQSVIVWFGKLSQYRPRSEENRRGISGIVDNLISQKEQAAELGCHDGSKTSN
jgi:hypothetical protein